MTEEEKIFCDHVQKVREKLDRAAGGRAYTLLAATKTQSAERINRLPSCGIFDYGENRVQEWMEKQDKIVENLRYHQIGRLQNNKIMYIINKVYLIHSVDNLEQAKMIDRLAAKCGRVVDCLLQINPAGEEQKGGVSVPDLPYLYDACRELPNVRVTGLMCMAPNSPDERVVRGTFASARACFERLQEQDSNISVLSMGMSQDAEYALQEGSTLVRIGTSLFGARAYPQEMTTK